MIRVCFQFVTKGRAVINSEPEEQPDMATATEQARVWMGLKDENLGFGTWGGGGAVVRSSEIEHIAVMPPEEMERLYFDDDQIVAAGYADGLRAALALTTDPATVAAIEQALADLEAPA